jgi:hypothetical protein
VESVGQGSTQADRKLISLVSVHFFGPNQTSEVETEEDLTAMFTRQLKTVGASTSSYSPHNFQ